MEQYRWLVSLINSTIVRTIAIFLFFISLFSALKQFDVVDFSFLGDHVLTYFFVFAVISVILALIVTLLLKNIRIDGDDTVGISKNEGIIRSLFNRIGSSRSLNIYNNNDIDSVHRYSYISRYDILDYDDANYRSIRILQGSNASKRASTYIPYCESTEFKVNFNQIKIIAYDVPSNKQLKVECYNADVNEMLNTHSFKIIFEKPLEPNQQFHIAYYLEFPNELNCLSKTKEIMSISLVRLRKKVNKLSFNVFLNFKPESVCLYSYDKKTRKDTIIPMQSKIIESKSSADIISLRDDILQRFPINLEKNFYVIGMEIPEPKNSMYIIEYSCSSTCLTPNVNDHYKEGHI